MKARLFALGTTKTALRGALLAGIAAIVLVLGPAQKAHAQSTQTPWQNLTPSQLTAVWWEWVLGIPVSDSPLFDATGANAASSQPYYSAQGNGDLFFLAGTVTVNELANGDVLGAVMRSISVPQGTAFFFPALNTEADNVGFRPNLGGNVFGIEPFPQVSGVPQLYAYAAGQQDAATGLHATLTPFDKRFKKATGPTQNLGYQRLQSPPFSYTLPATDNLLQFFGIDVSGTVAPAVSDGYWSFVPGTLPAGYYLLQFGGSVPLNNLGNTFTEAITYRISVIP